ncbi:MAG: ribonuclease III [Rikenellaceae bacterium]|nr:ribonuclease III [Rikenellaceae bacterium]MDE7134489.1 ribonuclease III [Rikenellaceae bacterium]MDE7356600.1 ribonuclease III [Rikenellaceae bacterium]
MFDRIRYYFKKYFSSERRYYTAIHRSLGIYPHNIEIYKLALVHRSASVVTDDGMHINNERLEYLGDAVIEAVVSDMLYIAFPYHNEGFLTQMRSKIVSRQSLNDIAIKLGLDNMVVAMHNGSGVQKHMYGDAFEAMMGATYLDKGYDFVNRLLINDILGRFIDIDHLSEVETDYKSRLIEWSQKRRRTVSIKCTKSKTYSDDGNEQFYAVVSVNEKEVGHGLGNSKKEAEQRACKNASAKLKLRFNNTKETRHYRPHKSRRQSEQTA